MSKLTDIIRREVKDLVSKQGGLMVTPAVVTAVQEDYLRADVKLLGNGAEIKGMLNKSPGKLTVGQTVTVAYETLPSSGVILIANGETDPLSEGGGWEVDSAILLDSNNVHDWVATQELMLDISTNTKLLYGGHGRLVTVQGYPCWFGSGDSVALTPADVSKFGNEMHVNMWRRDNASDPYTLKTYDCVLYVNSIQKTTSGGVDHIGYKFMIVMTKKDATTGTVENVWKYTTPFINDVTDAFIVMAVTQLSFLDTFTDTWYGYTRSASTPYGYVESMNAPIKMGYVSSNDPNTVHTILFQDGGYSYYLNIGGEHMCIPLGSEAEKCCNMSLVTRSEPSGGNNNA